MYLFTLFSVLTSLSPLQKLYTVCDVAMNIVISKSTTYSLESPKDPVLPARYFTQPDKVLNCCRTYSFRNIRDFGGGDYRNFFAEKGTGKRMRELVWDCDWI